MLSEEKWIAWLKKNLPEPAGITGVGDDAAVLKNQVVTKDLFVEGVHFRRDWFSLSCLAWKIITPNVMDCLAMGAKPQWFFLGIGIDSCFQKSLLSFMQNLKKVQEKYKIFLLGGDIVQSSFLFFSVTMIGKLQGKPLLRGQGEPGDLVFLSAPVGSARLGLENFKRNRKGTGTFLKPSVNVEEVLGLLRKMEPEGCIDVSDGLCLDFQRLAGRGYGLELNEDLSWIDKKVRASFSSEKEAIACALQSGEEPALAFLVKPGKSVERASLLGKVISKKGFYFQGKKISRLKGYDHFREL